MSIALEPKQSRVPGAALSLALLILINLVNYIDRYNLAAVEPHIRDEFLKGDPDAFTKTGQLSTAFLVTYMLFAPVFGWLAAKFNRWVIIGFGVLLWTIATGATAYAPSYNTLLLCRIVVGVGEAAWGPTAPTIIADMYPVARRGYVMAWFYVAIPVGSALGYMLGGQMAAHFSWHYAFLTAVPPGIVLGLWAFFRPDPPRGANDEGVIKRKFRPRDLLVLAKTRSYVYNTLGMAAMTFAIGGMSFWLPTYVNEYRLRYGVDEAGSANLGKVTFLVGVITVICGIGGTILGGLWGDKLRNKGIRGAYFKLSGYTMLAAFPVFIASLFVPFPLAWAFIALAMFLIFLNTGPTNTITANVSHPALRANAFGLNILFIHAAGDAISPRVIGQVRDATNSDTHGTLWPALNEAGGNMNAAFALVGAAILLAGVLWLLGARHLEKDTAAAGSSLAA